MKTVTISGTEYTFGPIKLGVGRKLRAKYPDAEDFSVAFVAASLAAGGLTEATPEWVDENVDCFGNGGLTPYLTAAYEANGLSFSVPKPGEALPPSEAADSTSTTATGQ